MKTILIIILSLPFFVYSQSAFIIGDEYLCDNEGTSQIMVSFNGSPPFTFVYSIDGDVKPSITTTQNYSDGWFVGVTPNLVTTVWTGKNLEGNDVPSGNYVYELYYQEWDRWKNTKRGTITLIR